MSEREKLPQPIPAPEDSDNADDLHFLNDREKFNIKNFHLFVGQFTTENFVKLLQNSPNMRSVLVAALDIVHHNQPTPKEEHPRYTKAKKAVQTEYLKLDMPVHVTLAIALNQVTTKTMITAEEDMTVTVSTKNQACAARAQTEALRLLNTSFATKAKGWFSSTKTVESNNLTAEDIFGLFEGFQDNKEVLTEIVKKRGFFGGRNFWDINTETADGLWYVLKMMELVALSKPDSVLHRVVEAYPHFKQKLLDTFKFAIHSIYDTPAETIDPGLKAQLQDILKDKVFFDALGLSGEKPGHQKNESFLSLKNC